jgi:type VI secretion system protein ImpH
MSVEQLFDRPRVFQFFQAVRLLERSDLDHAPVGFDNHPKDECVRFVSRIGFGFPGWDVDDVTPRRGDDDPPVLTCGFLGIANPSSFGSLPHPYTELLHELGRNKNGAMRAFFDCLNHRLISLFYRAWKKHHFAIGYERERVDRIQEVLMSVIGLGTPALRQRMSLDDRALLFRSGLLGRRQASATGLQDLLADYFEVPATIEQFVGAWYDIALGDQYRLGDPGGALGENVVIGSRYRTGEFQFRVRLGPLELEEYKSFLPGGDNHEHLCDLVRFSVGPVLDYEIRLVLRAEDVPPAQLLTGVRGERLGWSTWVDPVANAIDRDDGVFLIQGLRPSA